MYKFIRFFYQNKTQIFKAIAIIIFIIIIIQVVNYFVKENNETKLSNIEQQEAITTNNNETQGLVSEKSAVTGNEISKEQLKSATSIINEFTSFCNQQDLESAYNLLTEECKQQMYKTVESFKQNYYYDVFGGKKKMCNIENWFGDTYKVNINEDMLSTGKDTNGYSKQDYITVKEVDDGYKLNINSYIGYSKINKKTTTDEISMEVIGKNTFKDYEKYTIKVTNNTEDLMQLDDINSTETLYLEDTKGGKYFYYNHELTAPMLTIESGQTKELSIKFYSSYISTKNISSIVFSNIITKNGQLSDNLEFRANV